MGCDTSLEGVAIETVQAPAVAASKSSSLEAIGPTLLSTAPLSQRQSSRFGPGRSIPANKARTLSKMDHPASILVPMTKNKSSSMFRATEIRMSLDEVGRFEFNPTASTFVPDSTPASTLPRLYSLRADAPTFKPKPKPPTVLGVGASGQQQLFVALAKRSNLTPETVEFLHQSILQSDNLEAIKYEPTSEVGTAQNVQASGLTPVPIQVHSSALRHPFESASPALAALSPSAFEILNIGGSMVQHLQHEGYEVMQVCGSIEPPTLALTMDKPVEVDEVAHSAVLADSISAQYTDCYGKVIYYAPDNIPPLSEEQKADDYQRIFERLVPCVHHFNWLNQGVYTKSTTKPATSLAIIMSKPKHMTRFDDDATCYRKQLLINRGFRYIDPVIFTGEHESLQLRGSALENAAIGCTAKYYSQHGTWNQAELSEDDDVPEVDSLDLDDYPETDIVFNGATIDSTFPTRDRFFDAASLNLREELNEIQQMTRFRRTQKCGKKAAKSPLARVSNTDDLEYDSGFDWADESDEMEDLPAQDYVQVIRDLCEATKAETTPAKELSNTEQATEPSTRSSTPDSVLDGDSGASGSSTLLTSDSDSEDEVPLQRRSVAPKVML